MAYCHERKFWEQSTGQKTRKKDKTSGGSRGGARGTRPPLIFRPKWRPGRPPYLRVWLTAAPPPPSPLSGGLDPPLKTTSKVTGID